MNADWMSDSRKVPDDVMNYIRRIVVRAVIEDHESPEAIAKYFMWTVALLSEWMEIDSQGR